MVLRRHIIQLHAQKVRQTGLLNAPNAIHLTQNASANLAAQPAKHYTNATTVKNLSIILSAIKQPVLFF